MDTAEGADAGSRPIRPTVRGLALLTVFAVLLMAAVVVDLPTLLPVAAGLAVPLLAGPVICHRRRARIGGRASVHVHAEPAMVAVGEKAELVVTVAVTEARLPPIACGAGKWVRLRAPSAHDGSLAVLPSRAPGSASGWLPPPRSSLVEMVPRFPGSVSAHLPVPTGSRGVLTLRPLRWWIHDPFGLFACAGAPTRCPVVVVYPAPVPTDLPEPGPVGAMPERPATGRSSWRGSGDDMGELAGLRPYRPGDRLRAVHWPSRAGPGPLLVRDFAPDDERVVRILLDDRTGVHRRRAYDAALSVTHGLLAEAGSAGWTAELLTLSGRSTRVEPSLDDAARLLPLLALLNPAPPRSAEAPVLDAPFTVVTTTTGRATLPERVVRLGRVVTA